MQEEHLESAEAMCIRTQRLKVKSEAYPWLNAAATDVNQVWNYANETSFRAARPFAGPRRRLSAYDLDKLTAGASRRKRSSGFAKASARIARSAGCRSKLCNSSARAIRRV
jgi:hypothetical protein